MKETLTFRVHPTALLFGVWTYNDCDATVRLFYSKHIAMRLVNVRFPLVDNCSSSVSIELRVKCRRLRFGLSHFKISNQKVFRIIARSKMFYYNVWLSYSCL